MARFLALVLGLAGLLLACYDAFAPPSGASAGITLTGEHNTFVVTSVEPGSAADRAGVHTGDRVDVGSAPLLVRLCIAQASYNMCIGGRAISFSVDTTGRSRRVVTVTPSIAAPNAYESQVGRYIDLALAALYVAFGTLIMLRSARTRLTDLVVWLMMLYALNDACADYVFVGPHPVAKFAVGAVLQEASAWTMGTLVALTIAALNVGAPRLRTAFRNLAIPLGLLSMSPPYECALAAQTFALPWLVDPAIVGTLSVLSAAVCVAAGVGALALAADAPADGRVRARWFVSTLVVCFYFGYAAYTINAQFFHDRIADQITYYLVSFALVGPVYATLRHHLIDVDVALSRSAVVGLVSMFLLVGFGAAEWIAGKLSSALTGQGRWHGLTAQLLSFAAAVAIGLWFRQLHARTESSVKAVVFRERERRLRLLRQFAREADVVDDRNVLVKVTFDALLESLETADFAIYLADGDAFACVRTAGVSVPERLSKADRLVLTLLRDAACFTNEAELLRGWLVVPLPARTKLVGFLACGPKRDRTGYLPEEVAALESVAQHVGAAYAMLAPALLRMA